MWVPKFRKLMNFKKIKRKIRWLCYKKLRDKLKKFNFFFQNLECHAPKIHVKIENLNKKIKEFLRIGGETYTSWYKFLSRF